MPRHARLSRPLVVSSLLCLAMGAGGANAQLGGQPTQIDPKAQNLELPEGSSKFLPIHVAAMKADIAAIKAELDKGVAVDARIQDGFFAGATPLMLAARDADAETMRFLLSRGADASARDDQRRSVLMWASSTEGSVDKIKAALESGAKPEPRSSDGATALHWAAGLGRDPEMVQTLLDAGAPIDLPDDRGRTPLMTAARVGNAGAAQRLLAAGAERGRMSPQGLNALHWAAEGAQSNGPTIAALLDAGMAVESKAADGSTPLVIAALNGRTAQINELLARGANVNAANNWGLTVLMAAASNGSPDAVKAVLDAGVDVNARDQAGRVALHYAVARNNGQVTDMIARRKPDPNIADDDGWMPIHLARTMSTLDPIVRAGADVNARCGVPQYNGWTPLMFTAATGNPFLVRRLVNAGADPTLTTPDETTAMRVALAVQFPDGMNPIADIIRDAVAKRQTEGGRGDRGQVGASGPGIP